MKFTLELPDDLMRRVELHAAQCEQPLKDAVTHLLESGLRAASAAAPDVLPPAPLRLRQPSPLSIVEIEAAIAAGRQ